VPRRSGKGRGPARPRILYAYILREFLFSFFVAFLFFFVVFFVNQLLLMAEDILSKRAPVRDVLLLLLYAIPSEVAMSFPFASLVGALMSTGRMSTDNEFLVMQASGVPARKVFVPFAVLGLAFALVSFAMNDYFLPLGSIEYGKLYRSLIVSSPAVELKPWSTRRYKDVTIVTGKVEGSVVEDILIFDKVEGGKERVISARTASLSDRSDGSIVLGLGGVWVQTISSESKERVEYSTCERMEYRLDMNDSGPSNTVIGPYEMSSLDLSRSIRDKERAYGEKLGARAVEMDAAAERLESAYRESQALLLPWNNASARVMPLLQAYENLRSSKPVDRNIQVYKLEYYKKFSIPAAALCFVFLAFPLGLKAKRSGRSVGFGLGLLLAVLYWALLLGGQTLGTRLGWSPFWSMWGPDLFILAIAALFWGFNRLMR
jgi:lipopolysaccharide export system permease protein